MLAVFSLDEHRAPSFVHPNAELVPEASPELRHVRLAQVSLLLRQALHDRERPGARIGGFRGRGSRPVSLGGDEAPALFGLGTRLGHGASLDIFSLGIFSLGIFADRARSFPRRGRDTGTSIHPSFPIPNLHALLPRRVLLLLRHLVPPRGDVLVPRVFERPPLHSLPVVIRPGALRVQLWNLKLDRRRRRRLFLLRYLLHDTRLDDKSLEQRRVRLAHVPAVVGDWFRVFIRRFHQRFLGLHQ